MTDFPAQAVLARIEWGHDRAVPIGVLCEVMGWPRRAVEIAVRDLRLQGKAVASDGSGVWLGTEEDIAATISSMKARIVNQRATIEALEKTLRRMQGTRQLGMFDAA